MTMTDWLDLTDLKKNIKVKFAFYKPPSPLPSVALDLGLSGAAANGKISMSIGSRSDKILQI
jgi:hypothetical protein